MEHKEELIEQVERYLAGELTRKEVKEGNDSVLSDKALDEVINLYKTSESLIELSGLKEDLQSIHEEYIAESESEIAEPEGKKTIRIWWTAAVAAAAIIIAVVSGVFNNASPELDDYFKAYPDIYSFRGTETDISSAMRAYSLEQYEDAIARFDELLQDSVSQDALFYQAIAAMAVDKFQLAQTNLELLAAIEAGTFEEQVKWYLALAYWQNGDTAKAKEQLSAIENGDSRYKKAQELLEAL